MIDFAQVVDYAAGYDPAFRGAIEGASGDELEELQRFIGRELPPVYVDFLTTMGRRTGWIDVASIDFSIAAVLAYYRGDDVAPVRRYMRIGSDTKDPAYDPHLVLSMVAPELRVVGIPGYTAATFADVAAGHQRWIAGSMHEMFARQVFEVFEIFGPGRSPAQIIAPPSGDDLIGAIDAKLCEEFGFEPLFWSSRDARGFTTDGMAAEIARFGGDRARVLLRVDDPAEQTALADALTTIFGGEVSSPSPP